jgi:hypothetical protein
MQQFVRAREDRLSVPDVRSREELAAVLSTIQVGKGRNIGSSPID